MINHNLGCVDILAAKKAYEKGRNIRDLLRQLAWLVGDSLRSEKYYEECLSLPMFPALIEKEQDSVLDKVKIFML
jgi:dTDP-4-amino-4,6-dideoxygalactose transaminase